MYQPTGGIFPLNIVYHPVPGRKAFFRISHDFTRSYVDVTEKQNENRPALAK